MWTIAIDAAWPLVGFRKSPYVGQAASDARAAVRGGNGTGNQSGAYMDITPSGNASDLDGFGADDAELNC